MWPPGGAIMAVRSDPPPGKIHRTQLRKVMLDLRLVERRGQRLKRRGRRMERDISHGHPHGG